MLDPREQEGDAGREFGRGPVERWITLLIGAPLAGGVRDAPMDQIWAAGELGTDLPDPVAQADDVLEPLTGELVQVLRATSGDVDPACPQHAYRVGMKRLGVAAGAARLDHAATQLLGQGLGDLRTPAVARA